MKFITKLSWCVGVLAIIVATGWVSGGRNDDFAVVDYPAVAVLSRTAWELGPVENGSIHTVKFPIKNAGGSRLIIHARSSSCDCIAADQGPFILMPGESGELSAKLDTHNLDGSYMLELDYETSAPNLPTFRLAVSAMVRSTQEVQQ